MTARIFPNFHSCSPAPPNEWSAPRHDRLPLHVLEDGFIDWHPESSTTWAIFLSGELELESGGAGGAIEVFHAGDGSWQVTGPRRSYDRTRGATHVALMASRRRTVV